MFVDTVSSYGATITVNADEIKELISALACHRRYLSELLYEETDSRRVADLRDTSDLVRAMKAELVRIDDKLDGRTP